MKMEDWHSEWVDCPDDIYIDSKCLSDLPKIWVNDEDISVDSKLPPDLPTTEYSTNSPTFSRDSNESLYDESGTKFDRNEGSLLKTSLINASLAKKRLQAYSKQIRKSPTKEEKTDIDDKRQKNLTKKPKKGLYPEQRAKAVIQEIEEMKRLEVEDTNKRQAVANAIKFIQVDNLHHNSQSPDRSQQFKRREIKQRNYRRTDSSNRKSATPEDVKSKGGLSPTPKYPKDWTEYKKQNLTILNDDKFKYFAKKGFLTVSLLEKLYNFDLPSPPIESLKFGTENGTREIPTSFLKITRSRPHLMYSVNSEKIKESFLARDQLFELVSNERQQFIKDVMSSKHAKLPPLNKKIQSQSWYNKIWRKSSVPECKILETSIGLSFLQNYSDEEDDNETEEILICSTIKKNKIESPIKNPTEIQKVDDVEHVIVTTGQSEDFEIKEANYEIYESGSISNANNKSDDEVGILTPETNKLRPASNANNKSEDEAGILTPEISPLQLLKIKQIGHADVTEQKLQEKKIGTEDEIKKKNKLNDPKKKKKKTKRKMENSNLDEESPKKKKKKKTKLKKTSYSEESENSEDKHRKRKKPKKIKNTEKLNKKKIKSVRREATDIRLKNKVEICEQINSKKKRAKKKRKNSISLEIKSPLDDLRKKSKKKSKKKKREQIFVSNDSDYDKKSTNKKESLSEKSLKRKNVEHADISESHIKSNKIEHKNQDRNKNNDAERELNSRSECVKRLKDKRKKIKREIEDDRRIQQLQKNEDDNVQEMTCNKKKGQTADVLVKQEPADELSVEKSTHSKEGESDIKTPDTNEYRGNWEKDADPMWESEDESNPKQKTKLNSSWESDEELYETGNRPAEPRQAEKSRNDNEVLDLEIPLNIKPFKKREVSDVNSEFQIIKNQKESLNTERMKLYIEKRKVRKLQILAGKESSNKEECQSTDSIPRESQKIRRWDKKELQPKIRKQSIASDNSLLNKSDSTSVTIYTVLENEYEEFMKAVSSTANSSPSYEKLNASVISVSSTDSKNSLDKYSDDRVQNNFTTKEEEIVNSQPSIIPPKDIPFIPMPDEIKLQPVPSPEVKNISMSSINLNVSPNIANSPIHNNLNVEQTSISENKEETDFPNCSVTTSQGMKNNIEDLETNDNPKKTFSFATLVLPSKKTLLDNSNLKLGDSDDATEKGMTPIEEIRSELLVHSNVKQIQDLIELKENELRDGQKKNSVENEHHTTKSRSPVKSDRKHDDTPKKRDCSPKRESQSSRYRRRESPPRRREYSPKREFSPRRRRKSPERNRDKGRVSPNSRRYSSRSYSPSHRRRTPSPSHRRRTPSPRRRSPRRSISPRDPPSKKTMSRTREKSEGLVTESRTQISSPLEGLKRSVADSTISDDSLLPQPSLEEYTQSPVLHYFDRMKSNERISLDDRINLELGFHEDDFKPINTTYDNFCHRFSESPQFSTPIKSQIMDKNVYTNTNLSSNFVQVGNMVQIVPTDLDLKTDVHIDSIRHENKSQIVQVGNMLQIVPTELPPEIPLPHFSPMTQKTYDTDINVIVTPEKQSAEAVMKQKITERRVEREKRRHQRETRRKEKENRRREKEKQRQIKMKQKTENMIKRALQLEVDSQEDVDSAVDDTQTQWQPILNVSGNSTELLSKSILVRDRRKSSTLERKIVQFADGIKPGEGTSPSAGEDWSSPPPCRVLPKEKRYTKTKLRMKNVKKKVKVKIIKSTEPEPDESEEDTFPPPSPPPGSPPPHIFPPRSKSLPNTSAHSYVPNMVNQSQALNKPSVNVLMMSQALGQSRSLQQLHMTGEQQEPPLSDSPMQVHSFTQYQVPSLPPSVTLPLPQGTTESSIETAHRNHHYNYLL